MVERYDVVVCGGGLAGLTLSRQLRRAHPDLTVAVLEKTERPLPEAAHKVGESSVELGSAYLERLGLKDYLTERHLLKFGLRFFPGGGKRPLETRQEIGPINEPIVNSYQLDRGRFESDLRGMIETEDGVALIEGAKVVDVDIRPGDEDHQITVERKGETQSLRAGWLVDATGRNALLRSRMKMKRGGGHEAHASWFRVEGKVDINQMVQGEGAAQWMAVPESEHRWLSTNHLMGPGYWVWIIPLSSGTTSIGIVCHASHHAFDDIRTEERSLAWLHEHEPDFARFIEKFERLDFRCLNRYCHTVTRCWHPDRWAVVGEAGAFPDPLYSPGTDYIAFANAFTGEIIRTDLEGGDIEQRSRELNARYRALVKGCIDIYRHAAPVYGHAEAMATKVYWDDLAYWSFPCHYYLQDIYRIQGEAHTPYTEVGQAFFDMTERMQRLLSFWAANETDEAIATRSKGEIVAVPAFPSLLVEAHLALAERMSPEQTLEYMRKQQAAAEVIFHELLLRVVRRLGPELAERMVEELDVRSWGVEISPDRMAAEHLPPRERRRQLPSLVRDVERCLGRMEADWSTADAAAWLDEAARGEARA